MAGVTVRVIAKDALERLRGMQARGGNLTGLMLAFGNYMKGSVERNFAAGGRPAWPPLAPVTLLSWSGKYKKGGSYRTKTGAPTKAGRAALAGRIPLTDTGRLRRSIFMSASAWGVTLGTNVVYAAIHQFGGMAGRGKKVRIPARPFLVFQDEDLAHFTKTLANFVTTGTL